MTQQLHSEALFLSIKNHDLNPTDLVCYNKFLFSISSFLHFFPSSFVISFRLSNVHSHQAISFLPFPMSQGQESHCIGAAPSQQSYAWLAYLAFSLSVPLSVCVSPSLCLFLISSEKSIFLFLRAPWQFGYRRTICRYMLCQKEKNGSWVRLCYWLILR